MEEKPLTGEEVLQQSLGALNGNGMQQAANGLYELCSYMDSMTHKVEDLSRDVELDRMEKKQADKPENVTDIREEVTPAMSVAEPSEYQYGAEAFEAVYPKMDAEIKPDMKAPFVPKTGKTR